MFKAAIIDDELSGREVLARLIQQHLPELQLVGKAGDLAAANSLIKQAVPDILFLDIQLGEEFGFDLFEQIDEGAIAVIFVTGYEEYAVKALRRGAVDYLLKPVHIEELKAAVSRATTRLNQLKALESLESDHHVYEKLSLHFNNQVILILPQDILYVTSDRRYSHIHLVDGRKITSTKSLAEIAGFWQNYNRFCRIERAILVNLAYLKSYSKSFPCSLTLENNISFSISRRRRTQVLAMLEKA